MNWLLRIIYIIIRICRTIPEEAIDNMEDVDQDTRSVGCQYELSTISE